MMEVGMSNPASNGIIKVYAKLCSLQALVHAAAAKTAVRAEACSSLGASQIVPWSALTSASMKYALGG